MVAETQAQSEQIKMQEQQGGGEQKPEWLISQDKAQVALQVAQLCVDTFTSEFHSIELIGGPSSKDGREALARAWTSLEKSNVMYEVAQKHLEAARQALSNDLQALTKAAAEEAEPELRERTKKPLEHLAGFLQHLEEKIEGVKEQKARIEEKLTVARSTCVPNLAADAPAADGVMTV